MSEGMPPVASPPPPRRENYAWIGYFIFLVVASVGVAALMIWYNRSIQLTPQQLQAATQLWQEHGPHDYRMVYTKQLNTETHVDTFIVTVHAGTVKEVLMNGRPLEPEQRIYHSMEQQFKYIKRFMDIDEKPNHPPVYVTADFSKNTGALLRYIRSVMGTSQRVEMHITVEDLGK